MESSLLVVEEEGGGSSLWRRVEASASSMLSGSLVAGKLCGTLDQRRGRRVEYKPVILSAIIIAFRSFEAGLCETSANDRVPLDGSSISSMLNPERTLEMSAIVRTSLR